MKIAFKYRIFPNREQKTELAQAFGNARFVYNNALAYKKQEYSENKKSISSNTLIKRLPELKKEYDFLKISPSQTHQQSLRHLDNAYQRYFKGISDYPQFKSKHNKQSISFPQNVKVDFKSSNVTLPKIGKITAIMHKKFLGEIKTCTVSKSKSGKYFISILTEDGCAAPKKTLGKEIALDLGVKDFITFSDGKKIQGEKFLKKHLNKVKRLDKKLSLKKKGSNNKRKVNLLLARLHEKIANSRSDQLHKISKDIINENQVIFIEDLNVKNMLKKSNVNLARNIQDVSWGGFIQMLKYKSERYGKYLYEVPAYNTSKMCSNCGKINEELTLDVREWQCKHCHCQHDRDLNAAYNVLRLGQGLPEYKALKEQAAQAA